MISPSRLQTADPASPQSVPPVRQRNCPQIRASLARERRKEKDPGSAFGPESVPLATGLVPVVYWVPGPFPGPTPRPAGDRGKLFLPVLVPHLARGRLAAGAPLPWRSPDLISLPVRLASPVLD
jgi:hypothetical protein